MRQRITRVHFNTFLRVLEMSRNEHQLYARSASPIASIIHYANLTVPYVTTGFTILLVGFLVLAAGNVLRGL